MAGRRTATRRGDAGAPEIRSEAHELPDGVAIRPEPPRDGLGHDHDARLRGAFRLREAAPAHDIDTEHTEVFRTTRPSWSTGNRRLSGRADTRQDVSTIASRPAATMRPLLATNGWAIRAWSSAARRGSLAIGDPHRVVRPYAGVHQSWRQRRPAEKWRRRSGGEPMRRPGRRSAHAARGRDAHPSSLRRASSAPVRGGWPAAPARARRTESRRWRQPPETRARASQRRGTNRARSTSRSSGGTVVVAA